MTQTTASKRLILLSVILMDFLAGMEFDLFVPSFAQLQAVYDLTPFWVEALLSINFIGYCFSLFFVGGLADRFGRKPIILLGLIIFILGSLFCLFIPYYEFFLAGRFLQGVGVAAPAILSFLIIADAYPVKQQQFLLAMLNGSMNVAAGAAPVLGSYITLYFHWQGNFVALLVLGVMILIMTMIFIPHHELPEQKDTLSFRSYLPLFKSKTLMLLIFNLVFIFIPYWIFVGMSSLLYIKDLGVSLTHFGYYQGVLALIFAIGSIIFGLTIQTFDQKNMLIFTNRLFLLSVVLIGLATFFTNTNPLFITIAVLVMVIAQILPTTILYPLCLNYIPEAKGRISALIQGIRLILTAITLQIAGYFYTGTFQNIGIIIIAFIVLAMLTLAWVINKQKLMLKLAV